MKVKSLGSASRSLQELLGSFRNETVVPLTASELEWHRPLPVLHTRLPFSSPQVHQSSSSLSLAAYCLHPCLSCLSSPLSLPGSTSITSPHHSVLSTPHPVLCSPAVVFFFHVTSARRVCVSETKRGRERERERKVDWEKEIDKSTSVRFPCRLKGSSPCY